MFANVYELAYKRFYAVDKGLDTLRVVNSRSRSVIE